GVAHGEAREAFRGAGSGCHSGVFSRACCDCQPFWRPRRRKAKRRYHLMSGLDAVVLANKDYVAEQYRRYQADPSSVDEAWALFFAGFELGAEGNGHGPQAAVPQITETAPIAAEPETVAAGITDLVHSYRELGHLVAHLNPLAPKPAGHPLLEPEEFGFSDADLDRVVDVAPFRGATRLPL